MDEESLSKLEFLFDQKSEILVELINFDIRKFEMKSEHALEVTLYEKLDIGNSIITATINLIKGFFK